VLALVNLLAIAMLFPVGLRVLNDYTAQLRAGKEHPVFDPSNFPDLDIDTEAWTMDEPATQPGDD
jgi:AGCS family alanine or glycine:cation symporter